MTTNETRATLDRWAAQDRAHRKVGDGPTPQAYGFAIGSGWAKVPATYRAWYEKDLAAYNVRLEEALAEAYALAGVTA